MLQLSLNYIQFKLQLIRSNLQIINTLEYFRNVKNIRNSLKLNVINKLFNYIFIDSFVTSASNRKMFYIIIY